MRFPFQRSAGIRRLTPADRSAALRILDGDPVASILARVPYEIGVGRPSHAVSFVDGDALEGFCWIGANVVPFGFTDAQLDALAEYLRRADRYSNSFVGPADQVLPLWERVEHSYPRPREVRANQLSMVFQGSTSIPEDDVVRPAHRSEIELVLPASVAMFTEEVGYDPTSYGPGYANRVATLVKKGHTFIRMGTDLYGRRRVEFKADIGALAAGVAQIQGVWVHPDLRGHGIATHAMASVARLVRETIAPTVSLYVNDYNYAAVRVYEKSGFVKVGTYSTVLL